MHKPHPSIEKCEKRMSWVWQSGVTSEKKKPDMLTNVTDVMARLGQEAVGMARPRLGKSEGSGSVFSPELYTSTFFKILINLFILLLIIYYLNVTVWVWDCYPSPPSQFNLVSKNTSSLSIMTRLFPFYKNINGNNNTTSRRGYVRCNI